VSRRPRPLLHLGSFSTQPVARDAFRLMASITKAQKVNSRQDNGSAFPQSSVLGKRSSPGGTVHVDNVSCSNAQLSNSNSALLEKTQHSALPVSLSISIAMHVPLLGSC